MTLVSTIIQRAFRQENLIQTGSSPSTAEQSEAVDMLDGLVTQLYGFELGEIVYDWKIPANTRTAPYDNENPDDPYDRRDITAITVQPPSNVRLVTKLTEAKTVYMPQWPNDGARITLADAGSSSVNLTLDANGRTIEGAATVVIDPSSVTEREWFYRADKGDWTRIETLALASESPFPTKYDFMLSTGLAIWLAPRYGKDPRQITVDIFNSMKAKFEAQYLQEIPTPATYSLRDVQSVGFTDDFDGGFADGFVSS